MCVCIVKLYKMNEPGLHRVARRSRQSWVWWPLHSKYHSSPCTNQLSCDNREEGASWKREREGIKWHKWHPNFHVLLWQGFRSPVSSTVENFRGAILNCHLIREKLPWEQLQYKGWCHIELRRAHKVESVSLDIEEMDAISALLLKEEEIEVGRLTFCLYQEL